MKIQSSDAASFAGTKINEDLFRVFRNYIWVLDGSSGLGDKHILSAQTDAAWFVKTVDECLQLFCNPHVKLTDLVRQTIIEINKLFLQCVDKEQLLPYELPSCSLALVRINPDGVDYLLLGDITIVVSGNEHVTVIADPTVVKLDSQVIVAIQKLHQREKLSFSEAKEAVISMLRKNRSLMNTEGGYWVLGLEPTAVDHAIKGTFTVDKPFSLLVATDGFTRLVDTFHLFADWHELLIFMQRHGLQQAIRELRKIEASDLECLRFPRLKISDDATAVCLSIVPFPTPH